MVTQNPEFDGSVATAVNRGFVPEETLVAVGTGAGATTAYYRPFWRPVIAGAIFTISVFGLSWYLMLGCHVGVASDGAIALGPGAAVWLWITACIAYFVGGMIASAMTARGAGLTARSSGSLKGAVLWAVSLPLAIVIYSVLTRGVVANLHLPQPMAAPGVETVPGGLQMGFYWSMFIGLAIGLIFSLLGGAAGCGIRRNEA